MPQAKAAAVESLALNNDLPEAHAALGLVRGVYDWARQDALDHFDQMRRLDSRYASGLQSYAVHGLAPLGRHDDALDLLQRALAIDPVSLPINATIGFVLNLAGRPAEAAGTLRRTLALEPHAMAHFFLGNALTELGDSAAAIEHLQTAASQSAGRPDILSGLGYALARAGHGERARDVLVQLAEQAASRYVSPVGMARVHVALGQIDEALEALEQAARVRATDLTWISVEPPFRPLGGHPAFAALLQRLHLPVMATEPHPSHAQR
jgi:hypothetical protein